MHEFLPVLAGFVVGIVVQRVHSVRLRTALLVVLCLLLGAAASFLSGELALGWGFISIDAFLVWLGAAIGVAITYSIHQRNRRLTSH